MDFLKSCPFCGCSAELINDIRTKTWTAACKGTGCHANISVHYGTRKKLPFCTLKIENQFPFKDRKEKAKTLCSVMWNKRQEYYKFLYSDQRDIIKATTEAVNCFLKNAYPKDDLSIYSLIAEDLGVDE